MGRVGPEVGQQDRGTGLGGPAHPPQQFLVLLRGPVVDEVGQQEHVVPGGKLAGHGVAGDDADPVLEPGGGHPAAGQLDGGGQLEDGAGDVPVPPGDGDRPGTGAAADVEQPPVRGEIDRLGQCGRRPGEDRLDPGRGHLLQLVVELEDLPWRPAGQGLGQPRPGRVADLVPEPQEGAQVGGTGPGQEAGGGVAVAVGPVLDLEQAKGHHRVGADPRRPAGEPGPGRQPVQGRRGVGQGLEQPELVGRRLGGGGGRGCVGGHGPSSGWFDPLAASLRDGRRPPESQMPGEAGGARPRNLGVTPPEGARTIGG